MAVKMERHMQCASGMNKDETHSTDWPDENRLSLAEELSWYLPPLPDAPASLHRERVIVIASLTDLPGESLEMTQRRLLPLLAPRHCPARRQGETMLLGHANTLRALTMFIETD